MASTLVKYEGVSLIRQPGQGGAQSTFTRKSIASYDLTPDKVKGSFITFSNGAKFRRATAYTRLHSQVERGRPQATDSLVATPLWLGNRAYERSSPGGYRADDIFVYFNLSALSWAGVKDTRSVVEPASGGQRNEAITKALLDIANAKANIAEDLATFRQTIGLLHNPLSELTRGLRKAYNDKRVRNQLGRSFNDLLNGRFGGKVPERYLEYAYGWKPLMQDIYGIMEVAKAAGKAPLLVHGRGKSTRRPVSPGTRLYNASNAAQTELTGQDCIDRVLCSLWARVDPDYSGTRALNQLGLLNPASLAWELVPWSFVVDWVIPIGSVLQALTAPAGLKFVDGSISRKLSAKTTWNHWSTVITEGNNYPKYDHVNNSPATFTHVYQSYRRETLSGWPTAGLWIDLDPLRGDRSWKALALSVLTLRRMRIII